MSSPEDIRRAYFRWADVGELPPDPTDRQLEIYDEALKDLLAAIIDYAEHEGIPL